MCEQTPLHYKHGDIVWVKLNLCWWPGEVIDFEKLPPEIKEGFESQRRKQPLVTVTFFQEESYEYIRNLSNIYSYNCTKKDDFIRRGMDLIRAKNALMDKFPRDVHMAEERTGGNVDILKDPKYGPEKRKVDYVSLIFGTPKKKESPKTKGRPSLKSTASPIRKTTPKSEFKITHPRFTGNSNDHKVRMMVQNSPNKPDAKENTYTCQMCDFTSTRIEVIVLHNKSHIQGVYTPVMSKKAKRTPVHKTPKKFRIPASKTNTIDEDLALLEKGLSLTDHESSEDDVEEPIKPKVKRKQKPTDNRKGKKPKVEEPVEKKAGVGVRVDLLAAEWDEEEDEEAEDDTAMDSNQNTSTATTTSTTETKETPTLPEKKIEDKSCFDFKEEEDNQILTATTTAGRKIPRVIPEKRKSTEPDLNIPSPKLPNDPEETSESKQLKSKYSEPESASKSMQAELESKEEIPESKFVESETMSIDSDAPDLDLETLKEILESTTAPIIPELPTGLKCEQNFPNSKAIKFPDKKHESTPVPKPETSPKLINIKKRFVKSFEDFEQSLKIERAKEETKRREDENKRLEDQNLTLEIDNKIEEPEIELSKTNNSDSDLKILTESTDIDSTNILNLIEADETDVGDKTEVSKSEESDRKIKAIEKIVSPQKDTIQEEDSTEMDIEESHTSSILENKDINIKIVCEKKTVDDTKVGIDKKLECIKDKEIITEKEHFVSETLLDIKMITEIEPVVSDTIADINVITEKEPIVQATLEDIVVDEKPFHSETIENKKLATEKPFKDITMGVWRKSHSEANEEKKLPTEEEPIKNITAIGKKFHTEAIGDVKIAANKKRSENIVELVIPEKEKPSHSGSIEAKKTKKKISHSETKTIEDVKIIIEKKIPHLEVIKEVKPQRPSHSEIIEETMKKPRGRKSSRTSEDEVVERKSHRRHSDDHLPIKKSKYSRKHFYEEMSTRRPSKSNDTQNKILDKEQTKSKNDKDAFQFDDYDERRGCSVEVSKLKSRLMDKLHESETELQRPKIKSWLYKRRPSAKSPKRLSLHSQEISIGKNVDKVEVTINQEESPEDIVMDKCEVLKVKQAEHELVAKVESGVTVTVSEEIAVVQEPEVKIDNHHIAEKPIVENEDVIKEIQSDKNTMENLEDPKMATEKSKEKESPPESTEISKMNKSTTEKSESQKSFEEEWKNKFNILEDLEVSEVSKDLGGSEVSKDLEGSEVSKDLGGSEVSKDLGGSEVSKDLGSSEISKDLGDSEVSKDLEVSIDLGGSEVSIEESTIVETPDVSKVPEDDKISDEPASEAVLKKETTCEPFTVEQSKLEKILRSPAISHANDENSALNTLATISQLSSYDMIQGTSEINIEKNLTVVSELDLGDAQVEIAKIPVIEEGTVKATTIASFSVDFTEDLSALERKKKPKFEVSPASFVADENIIELGIPEMEVDLPELVMDKETAKEENILILPLKKCLDESKLVLPPKKCLEENKLVLPPKKSFEEKELAVSPKKSVEETKLIVSPKKCLEENKLVLPPKKCLEESKQVHPVKKYLEEVHNSVEMEMAKLTDTNIDAAIVEQPQESTTSSKLLEILTDPKVIKAPSSTSQLKIANPKFDLEPPTKPKTKLLIRSSISASSRSGNKQVILSEKIVKAGTSSPVSVQKTNDTEGIDAFIIHKKDKEVLSKVLKKPTKRPTILEHTIIKPPSEVIKPLLPPSKTEDNVFDIDSMPIVMSEDLITPENIDNVPIVIQQESSQKPQITKTPQPKMKILNKFPSVIAKDSSLKTLNKVYSKTGKTQKIFQQHSIAKRTSTIINQDGKSKLVIVPSEAATPTTSKYTVGKRIIKKSPMILSTSSGKMPEPTGNKIMIVTNNQGQQSRVVLTPAQQKLIGYQGQTVKKVGVKTSIHSGVKSPNILSQTIINSKGQMSTKSNQSLFTTSPAPFSQIKRPKIEASKNKILGQKLLLQSSLNQLKPGQPRTIIIKNPQGQTVKKIHGTDDALLEQQVQEQIEAINRAATTWSHGSYKPIPKRYSKKTLTDSTKIALQQKAQMITSSPGGASTSKLSNSNIPPLSPISKKSETQAITKIGTKAISHPKATSPQAHSDTEKSSDQKRAPHQLVIQDAAGNQTTITEGQILALPSETVDGQPQSYMLVTLDETGNLTPLNNEALMSLDPNLNLGGDLSNMVLQIDQGAAAAAVSAETPQVTSPTPVEKVEETVPFVEQTVEPAPVGRETPPIPEELPVPEKVLEETPEMQPAVEPNSMQAVACAINNGETNQQLIITGDPISTQKFLESLTEGNADLANLLANAEGNILIHADGQQILINTDSDNQMLLTMNSDGTNSNEGSGNPIFSSQPPKNQDILAAALADTDVFQQEQAIVPSSKVPQSQLSPGGLYPINVNNVLETSSMSSPIMTPLEVPSTNSKKIDLEADILSVPKNVDLPITITDPNIAQTVAHQQAALMSNELHANLELPLALHDVAVTSAGMNSPSFSYSLPTLDDSVDMQKTFTNPISMPLLTEEPEDVVTTSSVVISATLPTDIIEDGQSEKHEEEIVSEEKPAEMLVDDIPAEVVFPSTDEENLKANDNQDHDEATKITDNHQDQDENIKLSDNHNDENMKISDNNHYQNDENIKITDDNHYQNDENIKITDDNHYQNDDDIKKSDSQYLLATSGLSTISNQMCSSLSEPPPDMFDFTIDQNYEIKEQSMEISPPVNESPVEFMHVDREKTESESFTPQSNSEANSPSTTSTDSCEIPVQPEIVTDISSKSSENELGTSPKRSFEDSMEGDGKNCKFD